MSWCAEMGMMEDNDMDISRGVKSASDEEELFGQVSSKSGKHTVDEPHSHEILHHELMYSFRRVRHVHFAFPLSEVGLGFGKC